MKNPIETLIGGIFFIFAIAFLITGYLKADIADVNGYHVKAVFSKVGGISVGNDVKINGIKIGSVEEVNLNEEYNADVILTIKHGINLPIDTLASINADILIGDKYVNLEPGVSDEIISQNNKGEFTNIQNFKSLEDMVRDVVFSITNNE